MAWKSLDDMDLDGKRVLVRVDYNVPMADGKVSDTTRIRRSVPTLEAIIAAGGRPILLSHFGRPDGSVVDAMSLRHLVRALETETGRSVRFAALDGAEASIRSPNADILLVENTRFEPGEEKNDPELAKRFAALGDVYCNDAFSAAHRAHASTEGVARLLPACAGRLMAEELSALNGALGDPLRPVAALVGGAKVSSKIGVLRNLSTKVDTLVIGGGMANTFLVGRGVDVGDSLAEHDLADTAREIESAAREAGCGILLPSDVVAADKLSSDARTVTAEVGRLPPGMMILDAGPDSVARITESFRLSRTLIWNGPLGAFETEPFDAATTAAAREAARLTKEGLLVSVAGGGDTVAALEKAGVAAGFSYVSTAGGAFLEWMEGGTLPGVAALEA